MEFIQSLTESSQLPILTAFLLGLMTAISPCPLATNIAAIGYISRDLHSQRKIFLNGLYYTLGRVISYTLLGIILILILKQGSSIFKIQRAVGTYGELFIGPLLILIGVFMLGLIPLNFSLLGRFSSKFEEKANGGSSWGALMMGVFFALAFCPYSGILFFGGLIPVAVSSTVGYTLPIFFAIATGLPVIVFAFVLAFSISGIGSLYNKVKIFEYWFRRVVAIVFILIGIYYVYMVYLK
jgi:cytochrome c-type biogenesis protein